MRGTTHSTQSHLDFLDGLRACAALYVVFHHSALNLPEGAFTGPLNVALRKALGQGHYAVDVFIVLSGYCLMLPVLRRPGPIPFARFLRKRAVRILPTYFIAMIGSLLLIATVIGHPTGTHWDVSLPVTVRDVILHVLLVHDASVASAPRINHVFWSIGVEWHIYFLFPALVFLRVRWGAVPMALTAFAVGYGLWAAIAWLNVFNPSAFGSSPYYVGLFAAGMASAELGESERYRARADSTTARGLMFAATGLIVLATLLKSPDGDRLLPLQIMSAPVGLWTAGLLLMLRAGALPRLAWFLALPLPAAIGRMGYTVYLIHAPIVQLIYQTVLVPLNLPASTRPWALLVASTAATLLVAVPFYRFAERPFHALSRRL